MLTDQADTVVNGSLLLAAPIAVLAGLISFLSPCVLPLVPGYISYATGLVGADLADSKRGRLLAGSVLFVLGFTAVFVAFGALAGSLGAFLYEYRVTITRVLGVLTILLGLAFLGWLPWASREWRFHRMPTIGLLGAPLLGALFGLGWTPCIGPTLAAVQSLALNEASAWRGALLMVFYCIGLGLPFVLAAVAFRRAAGGMAWVKRHYSFVMGFGGGMLVVLGVLLVTGVWADLTVRMTVWASNFQVAF